MTSTENRGNSTEVPYTPKSTSIPIYELCDDGYDHYRKIFRQMQRVIDAHEAKDLDETNRAVGVLFVKLVRYFPSPMTVDHPCAFQRKFRSDATFRTCDGIYNKVLNGELKFHPEDQKRYIEELVAASQLFGVKRDPETGKITGNMSRNDQYKYWETIFDIPPTIRSVVFPIAVARYILSNCRIMFDPAKCTAMVNNQTVNSWDMFAKRYQDLILAA